MLFLLLGSFWDTVFLEVFFMWKTISANLFEARGFKKRWLFIFLFVLILAVGIFLRTYHFREWLYFYPDQARDAMITESVISGKTDWPTAGAIAASTPFRIGPMYYYFQIVTAKIFGTGPEKMAYPDLFFGILSLPLLYYFLRRYFISHVALLMMGLYAISFYAIRYSRFAWNPNPMPFFVMLFLLAMVEFLYAKETTKWRWVFLLGITTGVGMQLHTILFLLLPAVSFFTFVYLLIKNPRVWKKIVIVLALALILNGAQIMSEMKTNFSNTRLLFDLSSGASENGGNNFLSHVAQDVLCNAQANTAILSSLGDKDECNFMINLTRIKKKLSQFDSEAGIFLIGVLASLMFSVCGLILLFRYFRQETREREKYFLGIILLYFILSFIIMFPVIDGINLRYFLYLTFIPFLFLAFIFNFLFERYPRWSLMSGGIIIAFLVFVNAITFISEARGYFEKSQSTSTYIVLGELEDIANYIIAESSPAQSAQLLGNYKFMQNYPKPLGYILEKQSFHLLRAKSEESIVPGIPAFFIGQPIDSDFLSQNKNIKGYKNFGQIGIYRLENNVGNDVH